MRVHRRDIGELAKPESLPNGWVKVDSFITRTGVFEYRNNDGSTRRELRLPEEVFADAALASFATVPVTDNHPIEAVLDAANTRKYIGGVVDGAPVPDGDKVRAKLLLFDEALIAKMRRGKRELSCGYSCDLEEATGLYNGESYNAVQRNIRGNHVSVVDAARGGPELRARLDGFAYQIKGDEMTLVEYLTAKLAAKELMIGDVAKALGTDEEMLAKMLAYVEEAPKAEPPADAAPEMPKTDAKKDARIDELTAQLRAEKAGVRARVDLELKALQVLGSNAKLDALSPREVQSKALAKLSPTLDVAGKSDEYVAARFDIAFDAFVAERSPLNAVQRATANDAATAPTDSEGARKKMLEHNKNLWKTSSV